MKRVLDYLGKHNVLNLATHGPAGPWAAAVFYVNDGFTLYFLAAPTSRHSTNLTENPQVSGCIQDDCADWAQIKGVQLEGLVAEIAGAEQESARKLYAEKFPLFKNLNRVPHAIIEALARIRYYKLTARRLYFIDNSVAFAHREEIPLE